MDHPHYYMQTTYIYTITVIFLTYTQELHILLALVKYKIRPSYNIHLCQSLGNVVNFIKLNKNLYKPKYLNISIHICSQSVLNNAKSGFHLYN